MCDKRLARPAGRNGEASVGEALGRLSGRIERSSMRMRHEAGASGGESCRLEEEKRNFCAASGLGYCFRIP